MARVRIPRPLRDHIGGGASVEVNGDTAGEVLASLFDAHPGLAAEIAENGELTTSTYESFNLMIGREDMNELGGAATPIGADETVMIVRTWPAAISGGKQWNQAVGSAPPE